MVDKYLTKSNFVEVSKPNCSSNRLAARLELPCSGATATVDPLLVTMDSAFVSKRLPYPQRRCEEWIQMFDILVNLPDVVFGRNSANSTPQISLETANDMVMMRMSFSGLLDDDLVKI